MAKIEDVVRVRNGATMRWITSCGGPLVAISAPRVSFWGGSSTVEGADNDYERACRVNDYVGVIQVGTGEALVLGDEPLQTTWCPLSADAGVIARWIYGDREAAVAAHLERVPAAIFNEAECVFNMDASPLYLFDSAIRGEQLTPDDYLLMELNCGVYMVDTAHYEPDAKTALILHRLCRMS